MVWVDDILSFCEAMDILQFLFKRFHDNRYPVDSVIKKIWLISINVFLYEFINKMQFFFDWRVILIVLSDFSVVRLIIFFTCNSEDALNHLSNCKSLFLKLYKLLGQYLSFTLKGSFFDQLLCQTINSHLKQDYLFFHLLPLFDRFLFFLVPLLLFCLQLFDLQVFFLYFLCFFFVLSYKLLIHSSFFLKA